MRPGNAVREQVLDGDHQIGLTSANSQAASSTSIASPVENVAGSSVFPTGGQANPALPAVVLAMRLAEQLPRHAPGSLFIAGSGSNIEKAS
ncbi:hypothetical protein QA644_05260 [Rhizobium sp. CC1099]|uniref:hypothetical protein n=1 Tax=Rhizobium sp. CC1099 TaxID=3039160 RepID=UPI0024B12C9B|nr:hypothetical protein [Rhizobium sp. CC1099]WFU88491.1 hypothetical protein QA644_05260 [Rhizobium sp. CC1099]